MKSEIKENSHTRHKILQRNGFASPHKRRFEPPHRQLDLRTQLSASQVATLAPYTLFESSKPGELLCQEAFFVGLFNGFLPLYLHIVIDTCCNYTFGLLHESKQQLAAVTLLHREVLPFYRKHQLQVERIVTNERWAFADTDDHSYKNYLERNNLLQLTGVARQPMKETIEQLRKTLGKEFFQLKLHGNHACDSLEVLQEDLNQWLRIYNNRRPASNTEIDKSPLEMIIRYHETAECSS